MTKRFSLIAILSVLMATLMAVGVFTLKPQTSLATSATPDEVRIYTGPNFATKTEDYSIDAFTAQPNSMEAMVRLSGSKNGSGRYGVVIGGCYIGDSYFNFEFAPLTLNGVSGIAPRLYWNNGEFNWVVNYHLTSWGWYHVMFVRDAVANKFYCYINGDLIETYNSAGSNLTLPTTAHRVGRDGRDGVNVGVGQDTYLMGQLNYVGVSSTVFTAEQVKEKFVNNKRVIDASDSGAMHYNDFSQQAQVYYRTANRLTSTPNTFTATINLPTSATGYSGVIVGTFADDHGASNSRDTFNLEVTTGGFVRMIWDPGLFEKVSKYMDANKILTNADHTADVVFDTAVSGYSGKLNVNNGKDTHIAVVRDRSNGCFHLYINGVLASTKAPTTTGAINSLKTNFIPLFAPVIGKDLRCALLYRQPSFAGQIKDVAIYSNQFSAQEVNLEYSVVDKTTITKSNYSGVMGNWVFDSTQQSLKYSSTTNRVLADYSGNESNGTLCTVADYFAVDTESWLKASEDEYTMIYIPDTQCTVRSQASYMPKMFNWIADNAEMMNLSFVMGLGDIIDGVPLPGEETIDYENNTEVQWDYMAECYNILTQKGINWNAIVGNHDYDSNYLYVENGRKADIYSEHFGKDLTAQQLSTIVSFYNPNELNISRERKQLDENGRVKTDSSGNALTETITCTAKDMLNVIYEYTATTASGTEVKYLVVALEFGPSDDILAWASEVISRPEYVNHRVLVNSHSILFNNAEFNNAYTFANPESYAWAWSEDINLNNGTQMWNEFMSKHDNVFLTASGHIGTDTNITRTDVGEYGNTVLSTLCDGQSSKYFTDIDGIPGWGDPLILIAKVNEKTKKINYYYYNPVNNTFFGVENQWTYDFSSALNTKQIIADKEIELTKNYGEVGKTVQFTLTEEGTAEVKDLSGNKITCSVEGNVYTFTMPANRVNIEFKAKEVENPTSSSPIINGSSSIPQTSVDNSSSTQVATSGGCGGSITGSSIFFVCAILSIALVVVRKKQDN